MKKFLAILLIALVACEVVEQTNLKGWIDNLIYQYNPIGEHIKYLLQTQGRKPAIIYCARYYAQKLCEVGIDFLIKQTGIKVPE